MSSAPALGIDFGTTNSSMAWLDDTGEAEVILNAEGEAKTPSVVFFDEAEVLVGKAAMNRIQDEGDDPEVALRAVRSIKRNLVYPPVLSLPGGRDVRPVEVVGAVLLKLKRDAEEGHFREPVKRAVITHPAEFDAAQKDVLREAGLQEAGFEEVDLVPEPVAAALAFSRMDRKSGNGILVYDLGGGTFDVAVISRQEDGSYGIPVPPDGDSRCGGDDFDQALYDHCDRLARKELGRSVAVAEAVINFAFLEQCRSRKENLSLQERSVFSTMLPDGTRFKHTIERTTFEDMIRGRIEGTVRRAQRMMKNAEILGVKIDSLVLIGGSSRIPMVRREIERVLSIVPLTWEARDMAVALGAACYTQKGMITAPILTPEPESPSPAPSVAPPVRAKAIDSSLREVQAVLERFATHRDLHLRSNISVDRLQMAVNYCSIPSSETAIGLIYNTCSSAFSIFVFCLDGIYYCNGVYSLRPGSGSIPYSAFPSLQFVPADGMEGVWLGNKQRFFSTEGTWIDKHTLIEILNAIKSLVISRRSQ